MTLRGSVFTTNAGLPETDAVQGFVHVTTSAEVGPSPCSGAVSAVDVTAFLTTTDPLFIFHLFCLCLITPGFTQPITGL